ncbi:MAG: phospho-sugar mutase [Bacillota bacterium]|jgi:phosphoglucomutase|nr:phospho-sugar mutase [Bacillota bacterium]NLL61034.1 phospho-sugar mutase [Tissierellia bacterium]
MYNKKYEIWLNSPYVDDELKKELKEIEKIESEIEDRFYKDLEFGTGGMRGKIGAGTNRMNLVTVAKATQGIANYLIEKYKSEEISAAIAYDSRNMSKEFAEKAACVFAANNIKVYLFDSLRPTPVLSYAVRYYNCKAGVVITASHNPPEYNGYKVYDQFGGQVVQDADKIIEKINQVKLEDIKSAESDGNSKIQIIGDDLDTSYINQIKRLSLRNDVDKDIRIVFTPLHGTGNKPVRRVLDEMGYKNVFVVEEQENPDPGFSTVKSPNPEEISSFDLAIKKAGDLKGEIIIGTDPDCDRVGLVVRHEGEFVPLNGNQTGALLLNYLLASLKEEGRIPAKPAIVKTVVTSEIADRIADKYKVKTFDTLTGFKYIAELMQKFEDTKEYNFLFGYEESYGYLAGTFVRDKDAVIASMLICEMAAYYKGQGKTLVDVLAEIYDEHGYYIEETISLTFSGLAGQSKMKAIMEYFRENKLNSLAGKKIPAIIDYKLSISCDLINGTTERISYPKSDVLKFSFEDGSWLVLRPSGTEPKLKVYFSINGKSKDEAAENLEKIKNEVLNMIDRIQINLG